MLTFYYLKESKEVKPLVSFFLLPPPPPPPALISKEQAFSLAILTFAKTRFCGHINLTGRCFYSKVFPNGFRSNFYSSSFFHFNQHRHQIQCAQNSLSRNIMIITIRAMCQKRNELTNSPHKFYIAALNFQNLLTVLVQSIRAKIQDSPHFNHLLQIQAQKLDQLIGLQITSDSSPESHKNVVVPWPRETCFHYRYYISLYCHSQ